MGFINTQPLALPTQGELLCRAMPGSRYVVRLDELCWWGWITPSPTSDVYFVRLRLRLGQRPIIHVLRPELYVPENTRLPHTYGDNDLCLYFPDGKEWHERKTLSKTVLPWVAEWLYHYEIWAVTGQWNGGGTH